MNEPFSIVPPPEQVDQWFDDAVRLNSTLKDYIAAQAAQWGADQELEACCMWITREKSVLIAEELGIARRPNPPSLKEQALAELEEIMDELHDSTGSAFTASAIRRALEALDD